MTVMPPLSYGPNLSITASSLVAVTDESAWPTAKTECVPRIQAIEEIDVNPPGGVGIGCWVQVPAL
jgi:hypothetical protein